MIFPSPGSLFSPADTKLHSAILAARRKTRAVRGERRRGGSRALSDCAHPLRQAAEGMFLLDFMKGGTRMETRVAVIAVIVR